MKSLVSVGTDSAGRQYFAVAGPTLPEHLPWGDALFDALVFVAPLATATDVEGTLRALLGANTDWIFTAGAQTQFWHDRADQLGVELGRQQQVGDGNPMTASLDEVQSLDHWKTSYSFGGADYFLFVVVGQEVPDSLRIREHATQ